MLKNWFCKVQQIKKKSSAKHIAYLLNKKHPSHEATKITELKLKYANGNLIENLEFYEAEKKRKEDRIAKGLRGGGVVNIATSFVFNLPHQFGHGTVETWEKVYKDIIKAIAAEINIAPAVVAKHSFCVLHDESENADKDKSSGLHLLISNIIENNHVKALTQYRVLNAVKSQLDKSYMKHFNADRKTYTVVNPDQANMPLPIARAKKILEKAQIKLNKADELVEKSQNIFNVLLVKYLDLLKKNKKRFFTWKNEAGLLSMFKKKPDMTLQDKQVKSEIVEETIDYFLNPHTSGKEINAVIDTYRELEKDYPEALKVEEFSISKTLQEYKPEVIKVKNEQSTEVLEDKSAREKSFKELHIALEKAKSKPRARVGKKRRRR